MVRNSVEKPADYTPAYADARNARQAIVTRYRGATDARSSRILVSAKAGRMTVPWNYELDVDENHAAACRAYADKFAWSGVWIGGGADDGYVWVKLPQR